MAYNTYAHIDKDIAGVTVFLSEADAENTPVVVTLFSDDKFHPVNTQLHAECCVKKLDYENVTFDASIGSDGLISVLFPADLIEHGNVLRCEINISGADTKGHAFRYKSATFIVAVTT